jgi:chromodomain-helicase-DNA-binding protein 1
MTTVDSSSQHSDNDQSDTQEAAAVDQASDVDAPGEEYDEDDEVAAASDSSEDVDAEGEPDGDYDSESPPSEQAESDRARSSSEESRRPPKRKASSEKEDYIEQNPELYGLRRSVRGISSLHVHELIPTQGRARPSRRVVSDPQLMEQTSINSLQVDSDDEDDEDYSSDQPRKRQRTASRKSLSTLTLPIWSRTNPSDQPQTKPHQSIARLAPTLSRMATLAPVATSPPRSNANVSTPLPLAASLHRKPRSDSPHVALPKSRTTTRKKTRTSSWKKMTK